MDFWDSLFGQKAADGQANFNAGDLGLGIATGGLWNAAKAYHQTGDLGQALGYGLTGNIGVGANMLTGRFGADDAKAAQDAADAAQAQYEAGLAQAAQTLDPYNQTGQQANQQQAALMGLLGPGAQQQAYSMIQSSPAFQAMQKQGETAILQNAAATGGLRGGNTQEALARFSPDLLNSLIQQQLAGLSGISGQGLGAASNLASIQAGQNADLAGIRSGGIMGVNDAYRQPRQQALNLGVQAAGTAIGAAPKLLGLL